MSPLLNITGSGLGKLCNLKRLDCTYCKNVENDGLISLLKCASNLELLIINNCFKVTNSVVNVAVEVTNNRSNNMILELHISETNVNINEIKQKSPFLYLCN